MLKRIEHHFVTDMSALYEATTIIIKIYYENLIAGR